MQSICVSIPSSEMNDFKAHKALEIKQQFESLLFSSGKIQITNKSCRQIKKLFNEQINLTDKMFQGFHVDGREIGTFENDEKEIDLLYKILKNTPTLSFAKAERTIKKWISIYSTAITTPQHIFSKTRVKPVICRKYPSKKHELITRAYEKYIEEVYNKKTVVKTRGLDFVSKCYKYWQSNIIDPVLEEQINKSSDELYSLVLSSFDDSFTFKDFVNSLVIVLDISGSMSGIPIETGLFYMFMLVKVFGVETVHYFESTHHVKNINLDWKTNLDLINQIYTQCTGSTCLDSVFSYLNKFNTTNKNVIIITDGDCDPHNCISTTNPFHEVTCLNKSTSKYPNVIDCNFIIVNVKETKLTFPYLNIDPRVCYLTGNNPKTLNGFIKALCQAVKTRSVITPDLILRYTLAMDELILPTVIPKYSNVMTDERIGNLFAVFKQNLPIKNDKSDDKSDEESDDKSDEEFDDKSDDKSDDEESDDKPDDKSDDKHDDKPDDNHDDKPDDKHDDKSDDKSYEESDENSDEESDEGSDEGSDNICDNWLIENDINYF